MFKALVQHIDSAAEKWLPLSSSHIRAATAWGELHGWDVSDHQHQRLLVRQALLNAVIRQAIPSIKPHVFPTPVDMLGIEAPASLANEIRAAVHRSQATIFNFWGELYNALIPQSQRRYLGQFWTDEQIAEWMVAWLLQGRPHGLADVGCGAGNFLLKSLQHRTTTLKHLYGCDLSPLLLNVALAAFLSLGEKPSALPELVTQNYLHVPLPPDIDAVICNPPYTRHHQIAAEVKDDLQAFFKRRFYFDVSRQGTLAFYFLLKLIADMPEGARAAVIVPMEVLDARYGRDAKRILCQHTTISALIHFSPRMNAFHKVDVGASILLFKKGYAKQNPIRHLTLEKLPTTNELLACLETQDHDRQNLAFGSLLIQSQDELMDAPKWFSINGPEISHARWHDSGLVVPLKALAKVVRGIATGANEFFALPTQKVKQLSLEPYVVRTLQRNREIQDLVLDEAKWQALSDEGKRVWLLYLNGDERGRNPRLRAYLTEGEAQGYHRRSLVQTRKRWFAMEQRDIPAIFFTILTRGNPRFILNQAGVRPLNMFSLIYPNRYVMEANAADILWALLNSEFSLSRLPSVSRTYGGNTLKVEPRELDNLPVINPLALPEAVRQQIKGWISDFDHHRQAAMLMRQINGLVDTLLSRGTGSESHAAMPVQLQLLETREDYRR